MNILLYILYGVYAVLVCTFIFLILIGTYEMCKRNPIVLMVCIGIIIGILAWLYFEVMGYGTPSVSVASITDPRIPWDR